MGLPQGLGEGLGARLPIFARLAFSGVLDELLNLHRESAELVLIFLVQVVLKLPEKESEKSSRIMERLEWYELEATFSP